MSFLRDLTKYPWWVYVLVISSFFFVAFILNYILKKINEARLQGRFTSSNKAANRRIQVPRISDTPAIPRVPTKIKFEHPNSPTITSISLINNSDNYVKENLKFRDKLKAKNFSESIKVSIANSANMSMEKLMNQKDEESINQRNEIKAIPVEVTSHNVTKPGFLGTIYKELSTMSNTEVVFENSNSPPITSTSLIHNSDKYVKENLKYRDQNKAKSCLESKKVPTASNTKMSVKDFTNKRYADVLNARDKTKEILAEVTSNDSTKPDVLGTIYKELSTMSNNKNIFENSNSPAITNISLIDDSDKYLKENVMFREQSNVKNCIDSMKLPIASNTNMLMKKIINKRDEELINPRDKSKVMPVEIKSNDVTKPDFLGTIYKELSTMTNRDKYLKENVKFSAKSIVESGFDLLTVPIPRSVDMSVEKNVDNKEEVVVNQRDKTKKISVEITSNDGSTSNFHETTKDPSAVLNAKVIFEHFKLPAITNISMNNNIDNNLKENQKFRDLIEITSFSELLRIAKTCKTSMEELWNQKYEEVINQRDEKLLSQRDEINKIPVELTIRDVTKTDLLGTISNELNTASNAKAVFEHPNSSTLTSISLINSENYFKDNLKFRDVTKVRSFFDSMKVPIDYPANMSMEKLMDQKDREVVNERDEKFMDQVNEDIANHGVKIKEISVEVTRNDVNKTNLHGTIDNELSIFSNAKVVFEHPNSSAITEMSYNSNNHVTDNLEFRDLTNVKSFIDTTKVPIANLANMPVEELVNQRYGEVMNKRDKCLTDEKDENVVNPRDKDVTIPKKDESMNQRYDIKNIPAEVTSKPNFHGTIHKDLSTVSYAIRSSKSLVNADRDEILEKIVDKMVLKLKQTKSAPSFKKLLHVQNEEELRKWALDLIEKSDSEDDQITSK